MTVARVVSRVMRIAQSYITDVLMARYAVLLIRITQVVMRRLIVTIHVTLVLILLLLLPLLAGHQDQVDHAYRDIIVKWICSLCHLVE